MKPLVYVYLMLEVLLSNSWAGGTVTVIAGAENSAPIYVRSGWTIVNFTATAFVGFRKLNIVQADYVQAEIDILNSGGQAVYVQELPQYQAPTIRSLGLQTYATGSFAFYNPVDQFLSFSEFVSGSVPASDDALFPGQPFYIYTATGQSSALGGDQSPSSPLSQTPPVTGPTPSNSPNTSASPQKQVVPHTIYAVIISGLSDPANVLRSQNTTLIGGMMALGTASPGSTAWPAGLHIIPDTEMILGNKIPPVVPGLIDVRIIDFRSTADFARPSR
jgi:hypothetical protein